VTDVAVTPDYSRVIVVGMHVLPPSPAAAIAEQQRVQSGEAPPAGGNGFQNTEHRILVYDLETKQLESCVTGLPLIVFL
jgi:hypothetical protein